MPLNRRRGALLLGIAVASLTAVTFLATRRVEPFYTWFYQWAWLPVLLALDAGLATKTGRFALLDRPRFALALFAWSAPVWFVFELANFHLANWYYVLVARSPWIHWPATVLAFATVLPAIFLAYRWFERLGLAARLQGPTFVLKPAHLRLVFVAGVGFVALALWRPLYFFPLIWGAFTLLLEPPNYRKDPSKSLLGDIAAGRYARIVRLLAAGAAIGLIWESLNSFAGARWIYTVPGLEELKLFEMPLLGFLGFPVFALDCYVMYQALAGLGVAPDGWRQDPAAGELGFGDGATGARPPSGTRVAARGYRTGGMATIAAAFCALILVGMDYWTVDSHRLRVRDLAGSSAEVARRLADGGIRGVHAVADADSTPVAEAAELTPERAGRMVRAAQLSTTRGIGTVNADALLAAGFSDVCSLATAAPEDLTAAVRALRDQPYAGRPARVRVWIRAARKRCRE